MNWKSCLEFFKIKHDICNCFFQFLLDSFLILYKINNNSVHRLLDNLSVLALPQLKEVYDILIKETFD